MNTSRSMRVRYNAATPMGHTPRPSTVPGTVSHSRVPPPISIRPVTGEQASSSYESESSSRASQSAPHNTTHHTIPRSISFAPTSRNGSRLLQKSSSIHISDPYYSSARTIRPLPPVPKSASGLSHTMNGNGSLSSDFDIYNSHTPRPLPCVPSFTLAMTPASSHSSDPPQAEHQPSSLASPQHLSPQPSSHQHRHRRPPPSSLSVITSADSLAPKLHINSNPDPSATQVPCPSPITPDIPQAPSPMTARRKRMSKLRRHLGESIPDDLIDRESGKLLHELHIIREDQVYSRNTSSAGAAMRKVIAISDDTSDASDESDDTEEDDYRWTVENGRTTLRATPSIKRYSKKWMKDKGGKRWTVEEDCYDDVLNALRAL